MTNDIRPLITIDNIETGEVIIRPMDDEEYANWLKNQETDVSS